MSPHTQPARTPTYSPLWMANSYTRQMSCPPKRTGYGPWTAPRRQVLTTPRADLGSNHLGQVPTIVARLTTERHNVLASGKRSGHLPTTAPPQRSYRASWHVPSAVDCGTLRVVTDDPDLDTQLAVDPVGQFCERLRELRLQAGSPTFRELARRTHFSASTLASATTGKRLPTEAVLMAFVVACGQEAGPWVADLRAATAPSMPSRTCEASGPASLDPSSGRTTFVRRGWVIAGILGVAGGLAVGAFLASLSDTSARAPVSAVSVTTVPGPVPAQISGDGHDPNQFGCVPDAQLADKAPVLIDGEQVGALELKYSAHCAAGWARLYLYPGRPTMMGQVRVQAGDGRAAAFANLLIKTMPIYTDVIVISQPDGCLAASAVVLEAGRSPVTVSIPCFKPPR